MTLWPWAARPQLPGLYPSLHPPPPQPAPEPGFRTKDSLLLPPKDKREAEWNSLLVPHSSQLFPPWGPLSFYMNGFKWHIFMVEYQ